VLRWLVLAGAALVIIALADRILLAAEARGLVFYRRRRPSPGVASTALLEVMSIYEPSHQHVVDERRATGGDESEDDEPLEPAPRPLRRP
jgi:hypothetical protein